MLLYSWILTTVQATKVRQYQQAEQPPSPESLSLRTPNRHTSVQAAVVPSLPVFVCVRVSVYYRQRAAAPRHLSPPHIVCHSSVDPWQTEL